MRTRTKWMGALAAVATAATAATVTTLMQPASAAGPDQLPLTVTNNSGRSDSVHLYVLGTDIRSGKLGFVNQSGAFTAWTGGTNPPSPAPDVSINGPANGSSSTIKVPKHLSGRVYMSFGEKLKFFLTQDGLVQPAPWSPGDANHNILFDWSEFTYNDAGLWINSSQVDHFAVPHAVSVTGSDGATRKTGELKPGGREKVMSTLKGLKGWEKTVVTRSDGTVLRALAPGKAAEGGLFSANYLDSYITQAWNAYTGKTLTVVPFTDQPSVKFFGRTSGSTMNFTDGSGKQVASFQKPSTSDVWGCDGKLGAPNDQVVGPIARTLCAALHRSTLGTIDTQPGGGAADFYKGDITNHYSRLVHENMVDGRAYGFAFDDVQAQESLVHSGDPRSAGITLTPFTGGGNTGGGNTGGGNNGGGNTQPTTTTKPPTSNDPQPAGGSIVSAWQGKCVTVPNNNFSDGQRLTVSDCTGGAGQKWEFKDGTLRSGGMCADVAWGSTANGAAVQLVKCSGNAAQKWVLSGAGDLVNPQANKCVDIAEWNPANGAVLQIWECGGTANQKWRRA
ncbi:glycoside hydrolase family 64 protein [Actinosynnema pretiosum]|uniref:Glucan endo-1,3-beta-D-glucosidase n=1 Tax=Actinosynnema pretiosum TaxID=42197 RepID=A0A290Z2Q6_9PSEU|nr:beta-1,3-glucanase family protein [Actinosynnema pretiosum]ATE53282.1 glucan endo-1,3-beta-D-glucosidase [Actinosynnema pretiosum]